MDQYQLHDFKTEHMHVQDKKKILDMINDLKNMLESNDKFYIISGKTGVGKTHITYCMLAYFLKKLHERIVKTESSRYDAKDEYNSEKWRYNCISAGQVYFSYMRYMYTGIESDKSLAYDFKIMLYSRLLIIDDLGTERKDEKGTMINALLELLDFPNIKIIITTNLSKLDLKKKYGDKIYSRLSMDSKWYSLENQDYRRLGK